MRNCILIIIIITPLLAFSQASTDNWVFHQEPTDNWFSSIVEDKFGNIIVGGGQPNSDFRIYDGNSWTLHTSNSLGVPFSVLGRKVAADTNGVVWISPGEQGDGVVSWDGLTTVKYDMNNSGLIHDHVDGIGIDNNNNLWLSNLQSYDGVSWSQSPLINSSCEGGGGSKYFVTSNNDIWFTNGPSADIHNFNIVIQPCAFRVSSGNGEAFHVDFGVNLPVFDLFVPFQGFHLVNEMSDGTVFIAGKTSNGIELKTFNGSDWVDWVSYGGPEVANSYTCVWVDENDNILFGGSKNATTSQIAKYCNENWTFYDLPESMGFPNTINDIMIDNSGTLWIVGGSTGLCSLEYTSVPCLITSTEINEAASEYSIYFSDNKLVVAGLQDLLTFEIINVLGQSISKGVINEEVAQVGHLDTGIYTVRIQTADGIIRTSKILKY